MVNKKKVLKDYRSYLRNDDASISLKKYIKVSNHPIQHFEGYHFNTKLYPSTKDLSGMIFNKLSFRNANFSRTNLTSCSFKKAQLEGAIFKNVKGLCANKLAEAIWDDIDANILLRQTARKIREQEEKIAKYKRDFSSSQSIEVDPILKRIELEVRSNQNITNVYIDKVEKMNVSGHAAIAKGDAKSMPQSIVGCSSTGVNMQIDHAIFSNEANLNDSGVSLNLAELPPTNSPLLSSIPSTLTRRIYMPILADNRPTDYEYAILSDQAYNRALSASSLVPTLPGWQARLARNGSGDFRAVIFENPATKQWVVSFKGTSSARSLLEDVIGVINSGDSAQKAEAFKLVTQIVKGLGTLALPEGYQLSFTGHSLGGFLAVLSLYYAHTLKPDWSSLNAVVFECPGLTLSFQQLEANHHKIDPALLDIVGYVSYPNIVNTFDSHIGESLYTVPTNLGPDGNSRVWYTQYAHAIQGFIDFLNPAREVNANDNVAIQYLADWPVNGASIIGGERGYYFKQARFDEEAGRYSLPDDEQLLAENGELAANQEDNKLYERSRDLLFKGHYHILEAFQPNRCMFLRHFSGELQKFLRSFHAMSGLVLSQDTLAERFKQQAQQHNIPEHIISHLLGYELFCDACGRWYLKLNEERDITPYTFRQELSGWLANGGQAQLAELMNQLPQSGEDDRIKVITELLASGSIVDGIVLGNRVEGLSIYLPENASVEERKQAQEMLEHLKTVVKEVHAYLVAPGAHVTRDAILIGNFVSAVGYHYGSQRTQLPEGVAEALAQRIAYFGVADSRAGQTTTVTTTSSSEMGESSEKKPFMEKR